MSCEASRKTAHETNRIRITILALDRLQIADWSSTTHQIQNCSPSSRHTKRGIELCLLSLRSRASPNIKPREIKKIARRRSPYFAINSRAEKPDQVASGGVWMSGGFRPRLYLHRRVCMEPKLSLFRPMKGYQIAAIALRKDCRYWSASIGFKDNHAVQLSWLLK
jgi:hypothetical protein